MQIDAAAILLRIRPHGEHGAVVRALTREHGVIAGYVRGGRSRALRPVLQPANVVLGSWRARTQEQLAALTVELVESRAGLFAEPLPAAALDWLTALTAATLPEGLPYPRLHDGLDGAIGAVAAAPSARGWATAWVRFELLLLAELGFGLDLARCVATGAEEELHFVSPRSGGAVSRAAATGYETRLMPLPRFLNEGGEADWPDILAGAAITGRFLDRDLLAHPQGQDVLAARERLVERLKRAVA